MISSNVDVNSLLNENKGNTLYYKNISEDLFSMGIKVKQKMDLGVSPKEFDSLQSLQVAIEAAKDVVNSLE